MAQLNFSLGTEVLYKNQPAMIIKIVDIDLISIQLLESNIVYTIKTNEVLPLKKNTNLEARPYDSLTEKEWEVAKFRYEVIKPILSTKLSSEEIKKISEKHNIHYTTVYRWVKSYLGTKQMTSLAGQKRTGGKNKNRLDLEQDTIINDAIRNIYLNSSKQSVTKVIRSVMIRCKELDIESPHQNTIRNRIKNISEEEIIRSRYGKKISRDKFEPIKGSFPGANYPLSVVQIDHTCLDIILVDGLYRKPFRRPYLTVAIDVYSRMVVGFHLSFDPPGEMGTGLCIANAILGKEMFLEKNNIKGEWPCWGVMATIHMDNAKEFRGNMLKRACQNYGINIEHRPVATPHWGGHVERLLGTFSKEIHNLSGSTFSKIEDRENYDSELKASLTINEFEKWFVTYIVNVYHHKIHAGINMSPLEKYKKGIFGEGEEHGTGLPPKLQNERRVRLDFMPYVERTVQEYGVLIDHICYYDDVLRKYIHSKEDNSKYSRKQKFIFKRDPRDISMVYFFDPELNDYFEIPYRDTSKPPISIWEFNEVVTKLQKQDIAVNEDNIFEAYKEMEEIELKAIRDTKKLKKHSRFSDKRNENVHSILKGHNNDAEDLKISLPDILPFEDIDDEAFRS
ncbi:TPA: DDE-type integrase/transposase/recombinase [Elizabethkingia anophelis]|nr:DDE-type integrase/transposase/recombinase [Elizabethkingia anophelis]HAT3997857.1 DDE-type integrase/transposase/recombinase [Elizabethkingia anophelis]HAT4005458.1 DDE-type integrase/transposase/recombinase [Elizabethkingia anophelis]